MESKVFVKAAVVGVGAAVAAGVAQFVASDTVNVAALVTAFITTVAAFLSQSPIAK